MTPSLWVTILAGGVGSRFWPVSTPSRPKQLLPLASENPLIVDTLERVEGLVEPDRIRILTGSAMVAPIAAATGLGDEGFLVEPQAKGTGPVLAWAAWMLAQKDPDAVIISLHSDHVIRPPEVFRELLRTGAEVAVREKRLLTVAVPPDRPETGYGYIQPGASIEAPEGYRAYEVARFVEKPARETATRYVADGFRWNSGIFIWSAQTFLEEVQRHSSEIFSAWSYLEAGDTDGFFANVENVTVDEAILERSDRVGSIDATFQWDDVGSWEALSRTRISDEDGNVLHGDVHTIDASGNIVVADAGRVVAMGVSDLLVVQTGALTLIMPRSEAPDLKKYLSKLPDHVRALAATPDSDGSQ